MGIYFGSMLITVLANLGYHLSQRSISPSVNPLVSLVLTYLVALAATLLAYPLFATPGAGTLGQQLRSANWATYALGFAAFGLELGFLLVYRSGWKLSLAALYSNALVTLLLIPVGMLFFAEQLGTQKIAGIALTTLGLWLLGR